MDNSKKENRDISPAIKDEFEVVGVLPGIVRFKNQNYDLRTIDLKTAKALAEDNDFIYLQPKQKQVNK